MDTKPKRIFWAYKHNISPQWHLFEKLEEAERHHAKSLKKFHTERGYQLFHFGAN